MKTCPTCNNMAENNQSICNFCGRNIIGVKENYFDLKNKEEEIEKFKMNGNDNSHLVEKIYGSSRMRDKNYEVVGIKHELSGRFSSLFKKNVALFSAIIFLLSLASTLKGYKLILSDTEQLLIFLIPTIFAMVLFLGISLKASIKIKMIVITIVNLAFLGVFGYYSNFIDFKIFDLILKIENLSVIIITLLSVLIEYRYIKLLGFAIFSSFLSYKYYLYFKDTFAFDKLNSILQAKPMLIFTLSLCFTLFIIYELIFLSYEKERVIDRS